MTRNNPGEAFYKDRYANVKNADSTFMDEFVAFTKQRTSSILESQFKSGQGLPTFFAYNSAQIANTKQSVLRTINQGAQISPG